MAAHVNVQDIETEAVSVDLDACRRVAKLIESHTIPPDKEDSALPGLRREEIGNFYFLLVAICHQTSPRNKLPLEGTVGDRSLRGWDYLSAKLEARSRSDSSLLSPKRWSQITTEQIQEIFRDGSLGDRLSDPAKRALLVRNLGEIMLRHEWHWVDQMYEASRGRIASGKMNLLNVLSMFRAYDDPVRKKSFFFLALMKNMGLWSYSDIENLGAPVDYHEVRGHLRLGTVRINDSDLRSRVFQGVEVTPSDDIRIRRGVYDALMLISEYSGLRNPSQLHYLFWNVFRSCCPRENPHCSSCPQTCSLPERYVPLALFPDGSRRCPFSELCPSAGKEPKLIEHIVETDYY